MYLSIGYIHLQWTGPQMNSCSTRCSGRCAITFKNVGGNSFSSTHVAIITSRMRASLESSRTSFSHIRWKTLHILMMATRTSSSSKFRTATGSIYSRQYKHHVHMSNKRTPDDGILMLARAAHLWHPALSMSPRTSAVFGRT